MNHLTHQRSGRRREQRRAVLAMASAAQLMVVLDVSVINVALPSIRADLGFAATGLQWVAGGYLLAFGGFLLLGGRLADVFGRRRIFVTGLAGFTIASLVGGLADSPALLIAARAGQGLGAAVLAPATLTLLTTTFAEGPRRTRALATWTAVSVAGGAIGNLLGGALTEFLSWRATLLINVPIGALTLLVAFRLLPTDARTHRRPRLDLPGAILATAGLTTLTYAITRVQTHGWHDPSTVTTLCAAITLLVAFVVVEARAATTPLLPPRLLRNRAVSAGNVAMLLAGACFQAPMWYFLTVYLQDVLDYSALRTGLAFLPHTVVTIAVGWRLTPWLMGYVASRTLVVAGALIAAAGFVWQSRITPDSGYLEGILGPALVFSLGGGLLNTPLTTAASSGVPADDAGSAAGLMNTTKQVGGALGLSALITIAAEDVSGATDHSAAFLGMAAVLVATAAVAAALPVRRDRRPAVVSEEAR